MIVTHIGLNGETQRQMHAGETEVQLVPGMGGAMDLTVGAKKVFAATQHFDNAGVSKLMRKCRLPLTAAAEVDYIVTDVGFFEVRNNAFILKEYFTPYTVEYILAGTNADIVVDKDCMEVDLS
jgi:acetate CoA/acetoacetate CoA-transferase beta subunit